MQMDEGMDTGAILATASTRIEVDDDAATLGERLSEMGAALLREQLPRYVAGELDSEAPRRRRCNDGAAPRQSTRPHRMEQIRAHGA